MPSRGPRTGRSASPARPSGSSISAGSLPRRRWGQREPLTMPSSAWMMSNLRQSCRFRWLVSGDASAAPELVLSRGEVQAVQQSPSGTEVLVHSGDVMQGSSGGPIVDTCGRAIGMNTYIAVDEQQSGRVSYALSALSLESFVRQAGIPLTVQETPCSN